MEHGDPLNLPDVNFHRCTKKDKDKTKKVLAWIGARTDGEHFERDKIDFLNEVWRWVRTQPLIDNMNSLVEQIADFEDNELENLEVQYAATRLNRILVARRLIQDA